MSEEELEKKMIVSYEIGDISSYREYESILDLIKENKELQQKLKKCRKIINQPMFIVGKATTNQVLDMYREEINKVIGE